MIGGQAESSGTRTVGMGAQIAAKSAVGRDVPPGERWGGVPAKPIREVFKELAAIERLPARRTRQTSPAPKTARADPHERRDGCVQPPWTPSISSDHASAAHRYPFLLVDKIINIQGAESCVGIKCVTANEPQFQGHFPGQPILPGVMIIEGMAQAAGCAALHSGAAGARAKMVYFMTVDKAKFGGRWCRAMCWSIT